MNCACEIQKYKLQCSKCQKKATYKMVKLNTTEEPQVFMTTIDCPNCGPLFQSVVYDVEKIQGNGIKIDCDFKEKADLTRIISLSEMSIVKIKNKKILYEYKCGINQNTVLETLIKNIIEELCEMFKLGNSATLMKTYGSSESALDLANHLKEMEMKLDEKEKIKKKAISMVLYLTDMLNEPNFKMEIHDDSGISRVLPVGKAPTDMIQEDLHSYDDMNVKHKRLQ